jgi:hypothetical protein
VFLRYTKRKFSGFPWPASCSVLTTTVSARAQNVGNATKLTESGNRNDSTVVQHFELQYGSRLLITEMHDNYLNVKPLTGAFLGDNCTSEHQHSFAWITTCNAIRKGGSVQIIPAFTLTINKLEGLFFTYSYDAMSRVRNNSNIKIFFTQKQVKDQFLGTFGKLRKATISFVMSGRPSVCPHGTTRLPLDGFWRNLMFDFFENSSKKL